MEPAALVMSLRFARPCRVISIAHRAPSYHARRVAIDAAGAGAGDGVSGAVRHHHRWGRLVGRGAGRAAERGPAHDGAAIGGWAGLPLGRRTAGDAIPEPVRDHRAYPP